MSTNRISIDRATIQRSLGHSPVDTPPVADESMPGLQIFLLIFTSITMCVYILIISLVIYNRKRKSVLRGSFFRLSVSYFVADLIFFLEFNIFFRLRKYGFLNFLLVPDTFLFRSMPAFSNALHYYIKIVIYIGQIFFASNRLTSALYIMKYERYWTSTIIWCCRLAQFTIPLIAVLPLSSMVNSNFWAMYRTFPDQNTLRLETDPLSTEIIAFIDAGCSAFANIVCLVMYIATFVLLRKEYKDHSAKQSVRNMELRLLGASLMMFIVLTLNTVVQILTIVANYGDATSVMFVNDLSYPLMDCMYSCQPWALLLTSSVIRRRIIALFTGNDNSTTTAPSGIGRMMSTKD